MVRNIHCLLFYFYSTENTPMIVGLGKAAQVALSGLQKYSEHMQKIRDYFEKRLKVSLNTLPMIE